MPFLNTLFSHPLERQPDSLFRSRPGHPITARTLGDAVTIAATLFDVRIQPHDQPEMFRIYGLSESVVGYRLFGIFICRDGVVIRPNQDLSVPLLESDAVIISPLCG